MEQKKDAKKSGAGMGGGDPGGDEARIETYAMEQYTFEDDRGLVLFPFRGTISPVDPASIHVAQTAPGATRGNHYHPHTAEWLCSIRGEGLLRWRSPSGGSAGELHLEPNKTCIRIPPGIRHAITCTGRIELLLLVAREKSADPEMTVHEDIDASDTF